MLQSEGSVLHRATGRPNKELKLTKPSRDGASQLNSSVLRTEGEIEPVRQDRSKVMAAGGHMTHRWILVIALAFIICVAGIAVAADKPEDAAQSAAESWLKVVDAGDYAGSWDQAAKVFKAAVNQADWVKASGGVRVPLGKVVSRKLKSREYTEKLPGAPDGKYVVIQYDTVFQNKAQAVETVVPMADPDGVWRVSGYFIR